MPDRTALTKIVTLFVAFSMLWLGVALTASREIAGGLLPLLRWEISMLAPQFVLSDLRVARTGLEDSILAQAGTRSPRIFGEQLLPAGIPVESSTLLGHLLQPLVLMLSLVTTACVMRRRQCVSLALLSVPFALALVMLDVPLALIGSLENLMSSAHSPWVLWMNFLNGGGRLALGIGAAVAITTLAQAKMFTSSHTI
jgi:hypothetical protein